MTESQFIALAQKRYAELQSLYKINNFYDYEKEFESLWRDLGREVLEANISKVPADRRKKKHLPNSGKWVSAKRIPLAKAQMVSR